MGIWNLCHLLLPSRSANLLFFCLFTCFPCLLTSPCVFYLFPCLEILLNYCFESIFPHSQKYILWDINDDSLTHKKCFMVLDLWKADFNRFLFHYLSDPFICCFYCKSCRSLTFLKFILTQKSFFMGHIRKVLLTRIH